MMSLHEAGKWLRLTGPLLQLPALWILTQRPQFAAGHIWLVYSLFIGGLAMVLVGLMFSFLPSRRTKR